MKTITLDGFEFEPGLIFGVGTAGLGCFCNTMTSIRPMMRLPINYNGDPFPKEWGAMKNYVLPPSPWKDFLKRVGTSQMDILGQGYTFTYPWQFRDSGFNPIDILAVALENGLKEIKAKYNNVALILVGDNIAAKVGGWTGLFGAAVEKAQLGVLVASQAVANGIHLNDNRLCQVWMWTPPHLADVVVTPSSTRLSSPVPDMKTLRHNIKKHWPTGTGLMYEHHPELSLMPEEAAQAVVEVAPPVIKKRVVRARKPVTVAEAGN
jgi:hypothetical protein